MKKISGIIIGSLLWAIASFPAFAQTAPGWTYGFVPTTAQWNAQWASKQDYLGAAPLLVTGGTLTGPLITQASTIAAAGLNLPPGTAPTSPNNGDEWTTTAGLFVRINGVTIGPLSGATSSSFAATTPITLSFPSGVVTYACATCGVTGSPLSQFAATTSAQFLGVISDETGSGLVMGNNGPTMIAPVLGAATATSINKVAITAPATSATLTIANGKTLTASNSLTLTGTDNTSFAFPGTNDTVATLTATQSLTHTTLSTSTDVIGGVTMTLGSDATGDIYYRSSGTQLTRLGIGSSGNVLQVSGGLPSWQAGSSAGTITDGTTAITSGVAGSLLSNTAGVLGHVARSAPVVCEIDITTATTCNNGGTAANNGTYTTPTVGGQLPLYLEITVVGGGAGGDGGGTATPATHSTGGTASCWNTTGAACTTPVYQAGGGGAGSWTVGSGGTGGAIAGSATCAVPLVGQAGGAGITSTTSTTQGGFGGSSFLGGGGSSSQNNTAGQTAAVNTGSGGQGGGTPASGFSGPGGGAGATCVAYIATPASTYTYAVGQGGANGLAGTSGSIGGSGSTGKIIVKAYFN